MSIDELPMADRLAYGKDREDQIRKCLNERHNYNLFPASFAEDCAEKTDCWHVGKSGHRFRCAIKARISKSDILAVLREPFYGLSDEDTMIGRDIKYEYLLYITLSPDEKTIRVARGDRTHQIYNEMWDEWVEKSGFIDIVKYNRKLMLCSEKHPGCQLWFHRDRWHGRPKVLGFIPPGYLKEGKEIQYYPLPSK